MASIRLSNEFSSLFNAEMSKNHTSQAILKLFSTSSFSPFFEILRKMLLRYHYVHLSNVGFAPRRDILEAFASYFGVFRSPVENTNVRVDCSYGSYDGCSIESLPLHNDDVMLDLIPSFGILQVENECPLKMPTNGIVLVDDITTYLQLYDEKLLQKLLTHRVPMLSLDISKIIKNDEIIFKENGKERVVKKSILVKKKWYF